MTITEPEHGPDPEDNYPRGPASVCLEGPPQRQCYTAPNGFGNGPSISVIQLEKGAPALFFSAGTGGVSGFAIQFALLRPGEGERLEDLFTPDMAVSNQSQYAFWSDPAISHSPIFVTANYAYGADEAHYDKHRYTISAYVSKPSTLIGDGYYYLEDRYMTVHKYDLDRNDDVLASERKEILSRLRRVKAAGSVGFK
ncbi:MAG TPA: hypothetical protein VG345_16740 [Bryobacteraceae bacterium]|nr:hypothetical protein [Bryobacteraceae bacterium]